MNGLVNCSYGPRSCRGRAHRSWSGTNQHIALLNWLSSVGYRSKRAGRRAYDVTVARGDLPDPEWPDMSFDAVFQLAFEGRVIDTNDHPLIRQLEGRE